MRLNVPGHVFVCERLQVRDCQASERQEREELTASQLHCEHVSSSCFFSPRLVAATKASQANAKNILLGSISRSYQDNILVLGEVKLVTTFVKTSSLTCSLSSLFVQARKMMNV